MKKKYRLLDLDMMNDEYVCPLKRKRVCEENFMILKYNEYERLLEHNYNISQLKVMTRYYELKISGNKNILGNRLYNYLKYSNSAILIQKIWRGYLLRKLNTLKGKALFNRKLCVNETDFYTMEELKNINYEQFFSYETSDNKVFGFDIISIYNLYLKNNPKVENPYNRNNINNAVFINMLRTIKYCKIFNYNLELDLPGIETITCSKKRNEMEYLELCQKMDNLGHYTDVLWFTKMKKTEIILFIRELVDIWNYRAHLTQEVKDEICPSRAPFRSYGNLNIYSLNTMSLIRIQKILISIIDEFISTGINQDSKTLGAYYILCALTLVNHEAATAMPQLYWAVAHVQ